METNKDSIFEKIENYANKKRCEYSNECERQAEELKGYAEKIKILAPRIKRLLDVAKKMHELRVYIGEPIKDIIGCRSSFVTDGIRHELGFFVDSKRSWEHFNDSAAYPYAFGIKGGGADGCSVEVNEQGEIVRGYQYSYDTIKKMKKIISEFYEFEERFYGYVESLK